MKKAGRRPDLADAASQLAALIPKHRLDPAVLAWAESAAPRTTWAVAFSGGPDSLALLLLLHAHWPGRRRRLLALHFDHRMRGAESRADAVFCRQTCAALGVRFVSRVWQAGHKNASEAEARAARLAFFHAQARVIWLGHQQDDIAETMLMRLARGSGTGGLAAPRPVHVHTGGRVHLRPLLTLKKAEIIGALRATGIAWREDRSNVGAQFFRNRIRMDVVPAWTAAAQRDALAGAARSRALLEEDDAALEAWLGEIEPLAARGALALSKLRGKPRGLFRRALHRWLAQQPRAGELSRQAFEALLLAVERGATTRHSLGREGFAVTDGDRLWFEPTGKRRRKFQRSAN